MDPIKDQNMNKFFKVLIAGLAAKKYGGKFLGGGCLGVIAVFVLVYFLLGQVHC